MNELTTQKKQHYTIRATSCLKRMAQDIIELSQIAHEYHQEFGYQDYITWVKEDLKLSKSYGCNLLNVAKNINFSPDSGLKNFQVEAIFKLAEKSVPESAREEAIELSEAGETVTHAKAKEIAEAHKEIERLKKELADKEEFFKVQSNESTYPLIPQIQEISGELMPAMIRKLETGNPDVQLGWYSEYMGKKFAENQINEERRKTQNALEKAMKAIEEKESAIAKMSEVANNPDTAQIIANHEIDLKNMRSEYQRKLEEERKQMAQEASKLHARLNKEKIEKAENDKSLAEKREKEIREKANAAWKHNDELTRENRKLQSQFEVDKPENLDNAQAKEMQRLLQQLPYYFERIKTDNRIAQGKMDNTKQIIIEIIKSWSTLLVDMDSNETIEHIDKVTAININ